MSYLGRVLHKLRVWAGLADASLSHITPSHGWLLTPAVARAQKKDFDKERAARLRERSGRA